MLFVMCWVFPTNKAHVGHSSKAKKTCQYKPSGHPGAADSGVQSVCQQHHPLRRVPVPPQQVRQGAPAGAVWLQIAACFRVGHHRRRHIRYLPYPPSTPPPNSQPSRLCRSAGSNSSVGVARIYYQQPTPSPTSLAITNEKSGNLTFGRGQLSHSDRQNAWHSSKIHLWALHALCSPAQLPAGAYVDGA